MDIQENYLRIKAKYDTDVKPLWNEHPSMAYIEFMNFHDVVALTGSEFRNYHSGPLFLSYIKQINNDIRTNMKFDEGHLDEKLISDDFVAEFEAHFAQLGLSIKSENTF